MGKPIDHYDELVEQGWVPPSESPMDSWVARLERARKALRDQQASGQVVPEIEVVDIAVREAAVRIHAGMLSNPTIYGPGTDGAELQAIRIAAVREAMAIFELTGENKTTD